MRISSNALQQMNQEATRAMARHAKAEPAPSAGANEAPAANSASPDIRPAKNAHQGSKPVPPGLDRVLTRLQSLPASEMNSGKTNALASISRNIARYVEMQSIGSAPVNPLPVTQNESGAQNIEPAATNTDHIEGAATPDASTPAEAQPPADTVAAAPGNVTENA